MSYLTTLSFTRYLYRKSQVLCSLKIALAKRDYKTALFWAYELYRSGFQTEVFLYVLEIFETSYYGYTRLKNTFNRMFDRWKHDTKTYDVYLGSIIKNMCIRDRVCSENYAAETEDEHETNAKTKTKTKEPDFIVILRKDQIAMHNTIPVGNPWQYLREVCTHAVEIDTTLSDEARDEILTAFREQWLYYAYATPIWNMRFLNHHAKLDHANKQVVFDSEDEEERFMNKYNYEPEEQTEELQRACLGVV